MISQKKFTSAIFLLLIAQMIGCNSLLRAYENPVKRLHIPISGNVVLVRGNDTDSLLVNNYLSSNILELDEIGKISSRAYYPDGNTLDDRRDVWDDERMLDRLFTGHRKLDNLSVYHAGARFYSPTVGTFIQPDMKEGPNRYRYVNNNPVSFVDMDGNNATSVIIDRIRKWISTKLSSIASSRKNYQATPKGNVMHEGFGYESELYMRLQQAGNAGYFGQIHSNGNAKKSVYIQDGVVTLIAGRGDDLMGEVRAMKFWENKGGTPCVICAWVDETGAVVAYQAEQIKGEPLAYAGAGSGIITVDRVEALVQQVDDLYGQGFGHTDPHFRNIMVMTDDDGKAIGIRMIDSTSSGRELSWNIEGSKWEGLLDPNMDWVASRKGQRDVIIEAIRKAAEN